MKYPARLLVSLSKACKLDNIQVIQLHEWLSDNVREFGVTQHISHDEVRHMQGLEHSYMKHITQSAAYKIGEGMLEEGYITTDVYDALHTQNHEFTVIVLKGKK